jgi:hypothetical protein
MGGRIKQTNNNNKKQIYIYVLWGRKKKKNQEINCGREKEKFKTYVSGDRGGS